MIEVGEVRRRSSILRHVIKRWIYGVDLRLKASKSIVIDHNSREITADGGKCVREEVVVQDQSHREIEASFCTRTRGMEGRKGWAKSE